MIAGPDVKVKVYPIAGDTPSSELQQQAGRVALAASSALVNHTGAVVTFQTLNELKAWRGGKIMRVNPFREPPFFLHLSPYDPATQVFLQVLVANYGAVNCVVTRPDPEAPISGTCVGQLAQHSAGSAGGCSKCGLFPVEGVSFRCCAGCKALRYCSRECQMAQWREHKAMCRLIYGKV